MIAGISISCKNNKNAENNEATAEVVEAAKTILADDVLATIDEFVQTYVNEAGKIDVAAVISSSLTEEEKLIKPDYLLEAAQANELVTKSQKVNALAVQAELRYLIANNPEPFFRSISDEQWASCSNRYASCIDAVRVLAEYDEDIAAFEEKFNETRSAANDEEADIVYATKEGAKQRIIESKENIIKLRNDILK